MRGKPVRDALLGTLLLTLLLPVFSPAQSPGNDPATIHPTQPPFGRPHEYQAHEDPPHDADPVKSPGFLTGPFPVPVPARSPRSVAVHEGISLRQQQSASIIDLIQQIDESMVLGYLEDLTSFDPRVTESSACHSAGDYIFDEFQAMGLDVRYHDWTYQGWADRNIEATLHGSDPLSDEIYIICAHYDAVPGSPGADDNGSGTAAVLSAAYVMSQCAFNHTIRFVAFSGEEEGLLGSHEYVEDAYAAGDNIVATLNADMIGFALTADDERQVKVYANDGSMWLSEYTTDVSTLYHDYMELTIVPSGLSGGSDHYYFWASGYDALFYHEYNFNDYYHSPQDTVANMNLTYDMKTTRLIFATLAELAELAGLCPASSAPHPEMIIDEQKNLVVNQKNRFLSFAVGGDVDPVTGLPLEQSIMVKFNNLPGPYSLFDGNCMWVGEPFQVTEAPDNPGSGKGGYYDFWAAQLQCDKPAPIVFEEHMATTKAVCVGGVCKRHYENSGQSCVDDSDCGRPILHVFGDYIVPSSTIKKAQYEIRVLASACIPQIDFINDDFYVPPLIMNTSLWGDISGMYSAPNNVWTAADGQVLVPLDVMAVLSKVAVSPIAPAKARTDVVSTNPKVDLSPDLMVALPYDLMYVLMAATGQGFPYQSPFEEFKCPSGCAAKETAGLASRR